MENLTQKTSGGKFTKGEFKPAPADTYKVKMIDSSITPTKSGKAVKATFEIQGGEYGAKTDSSGKKLGGTRIFHYFNIENPSAKAVEIANKQLNRLLSATANTDTVESLGMEYEKINELVKDVPFLAKIEIQEYTDKTGAQKKSNVIKYFGSK